MATKMDIQKSELEKTKLAKKSMLEALEKTLGIVSAASKMCGVQRSTHYDWMTKDEVYKKNVEAIAEIGIDFAESKLFESIKNGSDTATIFYLKTKGKKRGYVERSETELLVTPKKIDTSKLTDEALDQIISAIDGQA